MVKKAHEAAVGAAAGPRSTLGRNDDMSAEPSFGAIRGTGESALALAVPHGYRTVGIGGDVRFTVGSSASSTLGELMSAGNGDALLLPVGQLARAVALAIAEA
jgi:hypothetical protein